MSHICNSCLWTQYIQQQELLTQSVSLISSNAFPSGSILQSYCGPDLQSTHHQTMAHRHSMMKRGCHFNFPNFCPHDSQCIFLFVVKAPAYRIIFDKNLAFEAAELFITWDVSLQNISSLFSNSFKSYHLAFGSQVFGRCIEFGLVFRFALQEMASLQHLLRRWIGIFFQYLLNYHFLYWHYHFCMDYGCW